MARSHIVSPLPAEYLRQVVKMLRKFADGYESAAEGLTGSDVSALHAEKFDSLTDGLDRIKSHFDQVGDGVKRSEIAALWEQVKDEPLPEHRYDRAKGGKPQVQKKTSPQGTTTPVTLPTGAKGRRKKGEE